jgi:predicted transcriptional regulator of viral defense system
MGYLSGCPADRYQRALSTFRQHGGLMRTSEALARGIHPTTLYTLRDSGALVRLSRGLYRLADLPPLERPALITACLRVPRAVICCRSALAFHGLLDSPPPAVELALPRGHHHPQVETPPIACHWFAGRAYRHGVEAHTCGDAEIRVYSRAKTVADCLKLRNQIGTRLAVNALRAYMASPEFDAAALLEAARICRVERLVSLYAEVV